MTCNKCNAGIGSLYIYEHIDYLKETVYKCRLCGAEQIISDNPQPQVINNNNLD